jgi:DNA polymerase-3 subunit epsilon
LWDVTFCVIDLETTGASPNDCAITEIGAVKLRGGECLGELQTLVNPRLPIPAAITVLTGITDSMVRPGPDIDSVLPTLLEFIGGAVLVGHNVRFDIAFLNAALERSGRPPLDNRVVDTCGIARRLLGEEVPNCRLGTLGDRLRLDHRGTHRALDDARATADLLHALLERAAGFGVLGLDDLVALPKMAGHPQAAKLRLTAGLPRAPGVYVFRDGGGRALYVGKATNLRARVRSYFSTDERRKVGQLLREARAIDHHVCAGPLEAAVLEVRMIHGLKPRFNRQATRWASYPYVKLTRNERFPRLAVVRVPKADGGLYLGPLPSTNFARRVVEAVESVVPLRRCAATVRSGAPARAAPCAPAQLGVATCPCAGAIDERGYAAIVERTVRGLSAEPDALLEPLADRIRLLAGAERFEEAADVRDRAAALSAAITRQRRFDALRNSGRLVVHLPGGGAILDGGVLVEAWKDAGRTGNGAGSQPALPFAAEPRADGSRIGAAVPRHLADELNAVGGWLDAHAGRVEVVHCDGGLASALPRLPSFAARR